MLPAFKMAATDQLHNFLWVQKIKKILKSQIIQTLQSHSPRYGDEQVILQGFKIAATINFIIFLCSRKTQDGGECCRTAGLLVDVGQSK